MRERLMVDGDCMENCGNCYIWLFLRKQRKIGNGGTELIQAQKDFIKIIKFSYLEQTLHEFYGQRTSNNRQNLFGNMASRTMVRCTKYSCYLKNGSL